MGEESGDGERQRVLAPLDVVSLLRAPYGWTNRMRREEGYPALGQSHTVRLGFWRSLALAVLMYGPPIVGALLGWRGWGGWIGAGLGAMMGVLVQVIVAGVTLPVVALVRLHRRR